MPPARSSRSADRRALVEPAPAKINLYLHVTGRRADGYHLLDGLVAFAEAGDVVAARPAKELTLSVDGPFGPALAGEADNLVLRAAHRLAAAAGGGLGASLTLTKFLPVASGIGGGSADAAAALRVLCRLWGMAPDSAPLETIARELGADVPVCLDGRAAFIGGIGEEREPAPGLPQAGLVLVNPRVALATPAVFARRAGPYSAAARFAMPGDVVALADILRSRANDLTEAAHGLVPAIGDVLAALEASPGCLLARMSGSGATCFGLFTDAAAARRAAKGLSRRASEWWVMPTRLLGNGRAE